jgi:predicted nucleotidyltransferase
MTPKNFDEDEARLHLIQREKAEKELSEASRKEVLKKTISILEKEFKGTSVEVYLVGSVLRPYEFSSRSDVDVVIKQFHGDRFALWTKLEKQIGRSVEIIPFETCTFQEFVAKEGLKIL